MLLEDYMTPACKHIVDIGRNVLARHLIMSEALVVVGIISAYLVV